MPTVEQWLWMGVVAVASAVSISALIYYMIRTRFPKPAQSQIQWFEARVLTAGNAPNPWMLVPAPDFREAASRYFHARSRHKVMLIEVRTTEDSPPIEVPVRYECPCHATEGTD